MSAFFSARFLRSGKKEFISAVPRLLAIFAGRWDRWINPFSAIIKAYSRALFNSLTFPGHWYDMNFSIASWVSPVIFFPVFAWRRPIKAFTRRGISSVRFRKGGRCIGITLILKNRSSRNFFWEISSSRFLLVAVMTRTSTEIDWCSPTRSNFLVSRTPKSFTCKDIGTSPISSKKISPPWAASNLPMRWRYAPVKAPLICPNSSLSRSASFNAAQLSWIKGPSFLLPKRWMEWATSSLPVPLSP